jgi:hypothetical protein
MPLKIVRFLVLLLAALTVGMKFAHVLELAPKLQWNAELYFPVQTSLYRLFGTVGPVIDVSAVLSAAVLAYMLRKRSAFRLVLAGVAMMLLSLLVWLIIVAPASMTLNAWLTTSSVPADWMRWRDQWQYGQTGSFAFDLTGFCIFVAAMIREIPDSK